MRSLLPVASLCPVFQNI